MTKILIVAEHANGKLNSATAKCLSCAKQMGASAIDYVRPTGSGWESLVLTYGQTGRRSRAWWSDILDQFGAADAYVLCAEDRIIDADWARAAVPDPVELPGDHCPFLARPAELADLLVSL